MRRYLERYQYDQVGNFLKLSHHAAQGNWTRSYNCAEASLLEPEQRSNRLSSTAVHPDGSRPTLESYSHDAHGNMTAMPHLALMQWDFNDQLQATSRQVVKDGTPETTYCVYDTSGARVRKVTERQNGTRKCDWTYLGGYEVYREYDGAGVALSLEREIVQVMDNNTGRAGGDPHPGKRRLGGAAVPLSVHQPHRVGGAGARRGGRDHLLRGILSLWQHLVSGRDQRRRGEPEALPLPGMERDDETGLNYHSARYYAPWLGRWTSCDPVGVAEGPNSFAYAASNPIFFRDPNGRQVAAGGQVIDPGAVRAVAPVVVSALARASAAWGTNAAISSGGAAAGGAAGGAGGAAGATFLGVTPVGWGIIAGVAAGLALVATGVALFKIHEANQELEASKQKLAESREQLDRHLEQMFKNGAISHEQLLLYRNTGSIPGITEPAQTATINQRGSGRATPTAANMPGARAPQSGVSVTKSSAPRIPSVPHSTGRALTIKDFRAGGLANQSLLTEGLFDGPVSRISIRRPTSRPPGPFSQPQARRLDVVARDVEGLKAIETAAPAQAGTPRKAQQMAADVAHAQQSPVRTIQTSPGTYEPLVGQPAHVFGYSYSLSPAEKQ